MSRSNVEHYTKYFAYLIREIEKKRQYSMNENNKSYIEAKNWGNAINQWCQYIIECVKEKPPNNCLLCFTELHNLGKSL